jgi:hypothetical protein
VDALGSCIAGLLTTAAVVRLFDCFALIFMSAARMYRVSDSRPSHLSLQRSQFMFARRAVNKCSLPCPCPSSFVRDAYLRRRASSHTTSLCTYGALPEYFLEKMLEKADGWATN